MEKINKEKYETELDFINNLIKSTQPLCENIKLNISNLENMSESYLNTINMRNKDFIDYLILLKQYSYSDQLSAPSEYFSGVTTQINSDNIQKWTQDTNKMKDLADKVEIFHSQNIVEGKNLIDTLKKCLTDIDEFTKQQSLIYGYSLELLQKADSTYDIGQIAKNT